MKWVYPSRGDLTAILLVIAGAIAMLVLWTNFWHPPVGHAPSFGSDWECANPGEPVCFKKRTEPGSN
jgi:hypothetical protein